MSLTSSKKEKEAKKSEDIAKAIKGLEDRYALEAKKLAEQCKTLEEKIERQNLEPERLEEKIISIYNAAAKGENFSAESCAYQFLTQINAGEQAQTPNTLKNQLKTMFDSLHKCYKGETIEDNLAKIKSESNFFEYIRDLILSLIGIQTESLNRKTFTDAEKEVVGQHTGKLAEQNTTAEQKAENNIATL